MALQKQNKTILLSGGQRDDADEFLLEPPATAYVENGSFDKQGVISKRKGFDALASNGLTVGTNGEPSFLHAIGDDLYTVANDGVYRYDGSAWTAVDGPEITRLSLECSTKPSKGASHFAYYYKNGYDVVAYERKGVAETAVTDGDKEVVFEVYASGTLVFETTFVDYYSPKLGNGPSNSVRLSVTSNLAANSGIVAREFNLDTLSFEVSTLNLSASTVWNARPITDAPSADTYTLIGEARQGNSQYQWHSFASANNYTGVFYTNTTGSLVFRILDPSVVEVCTLTISKGANDVAIPMAIHLEADGFYVLFAFVSAPVAGPVNQVVVRKYDYTATQTWSTTISSTTALSTKTGSRYRPFFAGSLAVSGSSLFISVSDFPGVTAISDQFHTHFRQSATSSGSTIAVLDVFHQTTVGQLSVIDSEPYVVHQRLYDKEGALLVPVASYGSYDTESSKVFAYDTTIVSRIDFANQKLTPIATADAGQAQQHDWTEIYTSSDVPGVYADATGIRFISRQVYEAISVTRSQGTFDNGGSPAAFIHSYEHAAPQARGNVYKVSISPNDPPAAVGLGDGIFIASGVPLWFDGKTLREANPIDGVQGVYPICQSADNLETPASPLAFVFVRGYVDASGNVHRSAPSLPVYANEINTSETQPCRASDFVTAAADASGYFIEVYVANTNTLDPSLAFFGNTSPGLDYVSAGGFTTGYLTPTLYIWSDVTKNSSLEVPFKGKAVYTTGGILAADPWPSFSEAVVTSTRIWAIASGLKGTVYYSKLFEEFVAPEFSSDLVISLGDERELTAIGKLDDKVVVFERNAIHVIYGAGPDNAGNGGDFAIHHISTDVGCIDAASLAETPRGLAFLSERGFHLLDRGLSLTYLSSPIEDSIEGISVTDARVVSYDGEVRFAVSQASALQEFGPDAAVDYATDSIQRPPRPRRGYALPADPVLVWNYETDQWSVYSNLSVRASTMYQGRYTILRPDWSVWQEGADTWTDPAGTYAMRIVSPWIKLSALQGYGRVNKISLLGRYLSSFRDVGGDIEAGDITVQVNYDYEEYFEANDTHRSQTALRRANVHLQPDTKTSGGTTTLIRPARLQVEVRPTRPKTQAVKIEIVETATADQGEGLTYTSGPWIEVSGINLEYGIYPGSAPGLPRKAKGGQ